MKVHDESEGFAELMKWPIVFCLFATSVPAGFFPVALVGAWVEWHAVPGRAAAESDPAGFYLLLALGIGSTLGHVGAAGLAWQNRDERMLGLSGVAWSALVWGAFAVGVACGVWFFWSSWG